MNLIGQPIAVIGLGYVGLPLAVEFGKRFSVTGFDIKAGRIAAGRPGDTAACWAAPAKAHRVLGWRTTPSLHEICGSAWRFITGTAAP